MDLETLKQPIYPYKVNALHFFALTGNAKAIRICFENNVKFIQDVFGKTPFDYAVQTDNKVTIQAILQGILICEQKERTRIMRTLPLDTLLAHPVDIL